VRSLGDDVLEVLSAAAVLGTEFSEDALIEIVESRRSFRPGNANPVAGVSFIASPLPTPRNIRPD